MSRFIYALIHCVFVLIFAMLKVSIHKNLKGNAMKKLLVLVLTFFCMPAFVPPPKAPMGTLAGLPADLRQEIQRHIITQPGGALNVDALAKDILRLAAINKAWRSTVNNLNNILIILKSLPPSAAVYLVEKLAQLPIIQENMLKILQTLPRSSAKQLGQVLANTASMKRKDVKDWLDSIQLVNGQELFNALNNEIPDTALITRLLSNPNIDVNHKNTTPIMDQGLGLTPLMIASVWGHSDIVRQLIAAGADVNAKIHNVSALFAATGDGRSEVVALLIAAGVDPFPRFKMISDDPAITELNGKSALDYAHKQAHFYKSPERARKYEEIIKLLENAEKVHKEKTARK